MGGGQKISHTICIMAPYTIGVKKVADCINQGWPKCGPSKIFFGPCVLDLQLNYYLN